MPLRRAVGALALCIASLAPATLLTSCVREHTLFDEASAGDDSESGTSGTTGTPPGGSGGTSGSGTTLPPASGTSGVAGAAGEPAGTRAPWDEAHCVAALSAGKTGEPCVDTFKCTATSNCCQILGLCSNGVLSIQSTCDLCTKSCTTDADCGSGKLCDNYACHDCASESCPDNWVTVIRSDCKVCEPPNECKEATGVGCAADEICVAGLSCLPGCKDDPACCFGNRCAAKGCGAPIKVDCLLVGCAAGSMCKVAGPASDCSCDPKLGAWSCASEPKNVCVAL